jgi:hypothetical protein
MPRIPAQCPRCQAIFPTPISISNSSNIELRNNITNCPVCGFSEAKIAEGVFSATRDAIEVISGPDSTRAMVEALKQVAERLKQGKITKEEAVKQAEEISPRYAALVNAFASQGIAALGLLIMMFALYLQWEGNNSTEEFQNKLLDAVTQQTFLMKEVSNKQSVDRESRKPTAKKSKPKPTALKNKSTRRSQVRKERRERLIERRKSFGGARTH